MKYSLYKRRHYTHNAIQWLMRIESYTNLEGISDIDAFINSWLKFKRVVDRGKRSFYENFILFGDSSHHFSKNMLQLLTSTSDNIYRSFLYANKVYNQHFDFGRVRNIYLSLLNILENLKRDCEKFLHHTMVVFTMTRYRMAEERWRLKIGYNKLQRKISSSKIDPVLGSLILRYIESNISKKEISKQQHKYVLALIDRLLSITSFTTAEIERLLLRVNFNTNQYYSYLQKKSENIISHIPGLHDRIELCLVWKNSLIRFEQSRSAHAFPNQGSLVKRLKRFYLAQKSFYEEKINLQKSKEVDSANPDYKERLKINLSVAQLALFIRLFIEHDLLPSEDIGKTFLYYARHYRTHKATFISPDSLQKKSTDIEFATARNVKTHLIKMLNWINKNYQTESSGPEKRLKSQN